MMTRRHALDRSNDLYCRAEHFLTSGDSRKANEYFAVAYGFAMFAADEWEKDGGHWLRAAVRRMWLCASACGWWREANDLSNRLRSIRVTS